MHVMDHENLARPRHKKMPQAEAQPHHLSFLPPSHDKLTSDNAFPPETPGDQYSSLAGERCGELSPARGTVKYTHTPSKPQPPTPEPTSHMLTAPCA